MTKDKEWIPNIWNEYIKLFSYIKNIYFHKLVDGKRPYEASFGHKPNISHFRIFGSRAWARIPSKKIKAFQPKIKE